MSRSASKLQHFGKLVDRLSALTIKRYTLDTLTAWGGIPYCTLSFYIIIFKNFKLGYRVSKKEFDKKSRINKFQSVNV